MLVLGDRRGDVGFEDAELSKDRRAC
jgi:hypothetical protein